MKLFLFFSLLSISIFADGENLKSAYVDYDAFEKIVAEVKEHRKNRLVSLEKFLEMSKEDKVIILDTRSPAMYKSKHIKGAVHLNFSDFTQRNLARVIPSFDTKVLIYCNNNFEDDQVNFASKIAAPPVANNTTPITLALNIPTYINLYGYGYKNVYELKELVSVRDERISFEGTSVLSLPQTESKTKSKSK
ncbi:MAG TPA: rhodanese-like domain-containing protein [Leptospiraceae bacterium]|nr:rhodanese-like domain-containing protein [Leptospiraceae bacterium]HMW05986.1 rhodanese-like domain-containing protein [Leptospiraceae bacterium]HMX32082.1 rhodanese-like domain-containing protein [Leptospiraceae bacterium]HMY32340.1 rhodanese-like domain-containing protein [Leptospiraceae bacterium]HMZ62458.1 rhodanese-like domain-containing protein [Leptospiraceae bacterium]